MAEVQINGQTYLCGRMSGRKQFHVVRRLTPLIRHLAPLLAARATSNGSGLMIGGIDVFEGLAALTDTIGEISDVDADYVIDACLDAVKFNSGGGWANLRAPGSPPGGGLMLPSADDFATQMRLVWEVLAENLANFSLETLLPFQTESELTVLQ